MSSSRRPLAGSLIVFLVAIAAILSTTSFALASPPRTVSVVVRQAPGSGRAPEQAVKRLGGTVVARVNLIDAFTATMPKSAVGRLRRTAGVASVTRDRSLTLASMDGVDQSLDSGSPQSVRSIIGAATYWDAGLTGAGVDVALIDSGVAPVDGLSLAGKVVNGPDLSFESQDPALRHLDTFGHGTHMAGIIAGEDDATGTVTSTDTDHFMGVAPGARIVSVKVADAFGSTDLMQVLVAIDWVVKHRHDNGLNIRVLNLSFGTDSTQSYTVDPLAYAVEAAWKKGIFVVVSAGNEGYGTTSMNSPAYDPLVMAVGADDSNGTVSRTDDVVASFSSRGDATRHPDILAPGRSIISLRDPGSYIDTVYPAARVGDTARFFRGSGTSQAAAVVSGAAALVIQQHPKITPDQLKALLTSTAFHLADADVLGQGSGLLDLSAAFTAPIPAHAKQKDTKAKGTGSIEAARGSLHLWNHGVELTGEKDIFGLSVNTAKWAAREALGTAWVDGDWMGRAWTGHGWSTSSSSVLSWTGRRWTSASWSGRSWTSGAWAGRSWTRSSGWTGGSWTGRSWTSDTWSGDTWSSSGWGT